MLTLSFPQFLTCVFVLRILTSSDEATLAAGDQGGIRPKILVGESVINYPFTSTSYLYSTKVFIGTVLFKKECPTDAPSYAPSDVPTER
jgi:hypothetical protein